VGVKTAGAPSGAALGRKRAVAVVCTDEVGRRRVASTLGRGGLRVAGHAPSASGLDVGEGLDAIVVVLDGLAHEQRAIFAGLRASFPDARTVATAVEATTRDIRDALAAGADAFVLDAQLDEALAATIDAACSGQLVVPRGLRSQIARPTLSAREKQVLGMVAMGFTNAEIARKLHLAESTVKSHLSSIFEKLGVRSRGEAAELVLDRERGFGTGILAISGGEGGPA
jgi:DNA-binding NarL/FixJ family response regulator